MALAWMAVVSVVTLAALFLVPHVEAGGAVTEMAYSITITLINRISHDPNKTFSVEVAEKGILQGAMTRLSDHDHSFRFQVLVSQDYGPILRGINGELSDLEHNIFWRFWVERPNGRVFKPKTGFACYVPKPDDHIIYVYDQW